MRSSGIAFSTSSDSHFVHILKMHKIFIAKKSHCACCVLSLATIRNKYYFNFIQIRSRSCREVIDHPLYAQTETCYVTRQEMMLMHSNVVTMTHNVTKQLSLVVDS